MVVISHHLIRLAGRPQQDHFADGEDEIGPLVDEGRHVPCAAASENLCVWKKPYFGRVPPSNAQPVDASGREAEPPAASPRHGRRVARPLRALP
jgi:hypothetical protein